MMAKFDYDISDNILSLEMSNLYCTIIQANYGCLCLIAVVNLLFHQLFQKHFCCDIGNLQEKVYYSSKNLEESQ